MSEYHKQTTVFNDEESLVNALVDVGYARNVIEVHKDAVPLVDYVGRQTRYTDKVNGDRANVIIRRNNIGYGSANDLGFKFNEETKTYDAFISQYDSSSSHWGVGGTRFKKLKAAYAEHRGIRQAQSMGFKFLGKQVVTRTQHLQFL